MYLFLAAKDKEKNKEKKFKEFVRVKPKKKKKKKKKTKPGDVSLGFPYHGVGHGVAFSAGLASQPALRRGRASSPLMALVGSAEHGPWQGRSPLTPELQGHWRLEKPFLGLHWPVCPVTGQCV